jgi:hypothetical protein
MNVVQIIESHPVPITIGAVALVALLMLSGGGSSSSSASADLALAENTNATNVQLAGISAQTQLGMANYASQVADNNTAAAAQNFKTSASLAAAQSNGMISALLGKLSYDSNVAQYNAAVTENAQTTQAGVFQALLNHSTQSQQLTDQMLTTENLASVNAAELPGYLQSMENIASINAQSQEAIAQIKAHANDVLASAQAGNATASQVGSYVQDAAMVAALFA